MTTLSRVDPELVGMANAFPIMEPSLETLAAFRASIPLPPEPEGDGITLERRTIAGPRGAPDLRILIHRRPGLRGKAPAVLYIHGGGFIVGSPEMSSVRQRMFAANLDCVVISTSYRLAPETRWPGPVEDVYATLCWIHDNADALGVDRERIALYGDSAGGGHAAALALYARKRGGPRICFQLLVYPMLDDRAKDNPVTGEFIFARKNDQFCWTALLGVPAGSDRVPPGSVPGRVDDLSGLPPAFICTGELDLFVDDNIRYANRLSRSGVPTGLFVAPGAYHGFDQFSPQARISRLFVNTMLFALESAFTKK